MKTLRIAAILVALVAGHAVAADTASPAWRDVPPDNLVLIATRYGTVAVELAPAFAPNHAERLRALIRSKFYNGRSFYRVIDGFVAQGGADEDTSATPDAPVNAELLRKWPPLRAEFDAPLPKGAAFTPLGNPDLFAPEAGHVDGFAVGHDPAAGRYWLIQCPGVFAFARDNAEDTATTEFYVVIGQAPRRLDRNLTAFGRVIDGMQYLQKLNRGDPDVDSGVIADTAKRDPIVSMILASDLPPEQRPHFQVMRTDSADFAALKDQKRHPTPEFYHRAPSPNLDICGLSVPVRRAPP